MLLLIVACSTKETDCTLKPQEIYRYSGTHQYSNPTDIIGIVTLDSVFVLSNTQSDYWLLNDLIVTVKGDKLFLGTQKIGFYTLDTLDLMYTLDSITYIYRGHDINLP